MTPFEGLFNPEIKCNEMNKVETTYNAINMRIVENKLTPFEG